MLETISMFISHHWQKLFVFSPEILMLFVLFFFSLSIKSFPTTYKIRNTYLFFLNKGALFSLKVITKPLVMCLFLYCVYLAIFLRYEFYQNFNKYFINSYVFYMEFITLLWCILNTLALAKFKILKWLIRKNYTTSYILLKMVGNSLQAIILLVLANILIPQLNLGGFSAHLLDKITRFFLIGTIGWIFLQIVNGVEQLIISRLTLNHSRNVYARKINTQVTILKKVIIILGMFIIISSMLMVFDSVRSIGKGLLTTAGIIGAAGAFASQRSLSSLFSGLKIAITQPIRIGDSIVIDNDSGQVEEITLSYVVIKLWDLRRLILPTDYFINKGVYNLTRNSSELAGTIMFYVDYIIPVDKLREKFLDLLSQSELWDKRSSSFQISELKEQSVEIRATVSARNSSDLWNLRCDIREKLLNYIIENFPKALPKTRQLLEQ